jgi:hypothetical protein
MAKYLVQHRRGSASQWAEKNTIIPKEGEIVIEIDEENSLHKLKIGDGIHTYAELAYLQAGDEVVTQVLAKALPRIITINLNKDAWESVQYKDNPNLTCYKQTIPIDGVTSRTKLNLQPDAIMLAEFQKLNLVFVAENEIDGTTHENEITVYSIGDKPSNSYTMQATIVEAEIQDGQNKVVGIPVGTPVAQPDWNQTDEARTDYIKNKPENIMKYKSMVDMLPSSANEGDVYKISETIYESNTIIIPNIALDGIKDMYDLGDGVTGIRIIEGSILDNVLSCCYKAGIISFVVNDILYTAELVDYDSMTKRGRIRNNSEGFFQYWYSAQKFIIPDEYIDENIEAYKPIIYFKGECVIYRDGKWQKLESDEIRNVNTELKRLEAETEIAYDHFWDFFKYFTEYKVETDLSNVDDVVFKNKAEEAGVGGDCVFSEDGNNNVTTEGNTANCMAFYIKSIDLNNKKIYLSNVYTVPVISTTNNKDASFATPEYTVGDKFSIINKNHYNDCGTITAVENNVISYFEDNLGFDAILEDTDVSDSDYTFHVYNKPNIGVVSVTNYAFSVGKNNKALGAYSVAEGYGNIADGFHSHAEGRETKAAYAAHAEGRDTIARGNYSHAEGQNTQSNGVASHTEGQNNIVYGLGSHGEGANNTTNASYSHIEGCDNTTEDTAKHSHNEGKSNTVSGENAHAEGYRNIVSGNSAHAEGASGQATASYAHVEGTASVASGVASHAEGNATNASGNGAHTEGQGTIASASQAHAEGYKTEATYQAAHAEGYITKATKIGAHAEGSSTEATGDGSHAEGYDTVASGPYAHAEGSGTTAKSFVTHAEGQGTIARGNAQHVQGKYNIEDTSSRYSHIIGNGTSEARKNIHTVDWSGNAWFSGDVKVGGASQDSGVALAKSDLSNIDNAAFKAKAEEAGINGGADFMSNGVFMIIKGVVSALPDTAKDGDFYILDKWNKVGTYNNNDGMVLYSNGFSFSVWNSMSNAIYEHIQKNYNGKYRFTIDGKTYSYTDCMINSVSEEGLYIAGETLNVTEDITVTNGTIVEVYSLTKDEVSEKKKYVYYNGEWIDM